MIYFKCIYFLLLVFESCWICLVIPNNNNNNKKTLNENSLDYLCGSCCNSTLHCTTGRQLSCLLGRVPGLKTDVTAPFFQQLLQNTENDLSAHIRSILSFKSVLKLC